MTKMKEQTKTPEKDLKEREISNLSDAEFKRLVIRMHKKVSEDHSGIKKIHSGTKDILIERMTHIQGNNSKVHEAKNQINDLEHKE